MTKQCEIVPKIVFQLASITYRIVAKLEASDGMNETSNVTSVVGTISLTPAERILESFLTNNITLFQDIIRSKEIVKSLCLAQDELAGETLMTYMIRNTPEDNTALQYVSLLLSAGVDPTVSNFDGVTPLLASLQANDKLVTMRLLEYFLEYIVSVGNTNVVKSISRSDSLGRTSLCEALVTEQLDVVDLLLDLGVTHGCRLSKEWCCNPVVLAIPVADGVVVKRLLSLYSDITGFLSKALEKALQYGREDIIFLLLQQTSRTVELRHLPDALYTEAKSRVKYLFTAMETGRNETLVDAMLELETKWRNPELCSLMNTDGRTLLFHAIYYGYRNVTERLIAFYDMMVNGKYTGYVHCYGDKADRVGQCPSSVLVQSHKWKDKEQKRRILLFLFSKRHPISGENCFQDALEKKESVVSVFRDIGDYAATHYGPEILDLAGVDAAKKDIFISAIESRAPQPAIILILKWLLDGASHGYSNYSLSLAQGLLRAAGGTGNREDPFFVAEAYPDVIDAAAVICPGFLYKLLLNIPLSNPNNESPYRKILNAISGPFPSSQDSPLSNSVEGSLDTFNIWSSTSFLQELLGSYHHFRFKTVHFVYALDVVARRKVVKGEFSDLYFVTRESSSIFPTLRYIIAVYIRRLTNLPLYPILGDKRIITKGTTARERFLEYDSAFKKRASVIVELLKSPLAKPNVAIEQLSFYLFWLTLVYFFIVSLCHVILITYSNGSRFMMCHYFFTDMIPHSASNWCTAFGEGLRRGCLMPRLSNVGMVVGETLHIRCVLYLVQLMSWFRPIAFLWCVVEISVLTCNTNNVETSLERRPNSLAFIYVSPLRYLFPCTVMVHALISKLTCKEQEKWIAWLLCGQNTQTDFNSHIDLVLRSFYWLVKSQREITSYKRSCERLSIYPSIKKFRSTANGNVRTSHESVHGRSKSLVDKMYGRKLPLNLIKTCRARKVMRGFIFAPTQHFVCCKKRIFQKKQLFRKLGEKNEGYAVAEDLEGSLIATCVLEFEKFCKTNYVRDLLILYVSSFVVTHFPLWRCLSRSLKLLYFDIFFSEAKFQEYMSQHSSILLLREFLMYSVLWHQLVQLGLPILLGIRLIATMRRTARALRKRFPKREKHRGMMLEDFPPTCFNGHGVRATQKGKKHLMSRSIMTAIRVYIDVRQSLFRQFAYVWEPVKKALNLFLLYWVTVLVVMYPYFHCGNLRQNFFSPSYNQPASQLFLTLFWIQWLAIQGLRANVEFERGWIPVQRIHCMPRELAFYRKRSEVQLQAISFFKPREFRLALASFRLGISFSAVYLFLYTAFLVEFIFFI